MTAELIDTGIPGLTHADVDALAAREPAWLADQRRAAWRTYETLDLPDPGDEEWRRTNLREMTFTAVRPVALDGDGSGSRTDGVIVTELAAAAAEQAGLVHQRLGSLVPANEWKFVALNAALWSGGHLVHIPAGVDASTPVVLTTRGLASGGAAFPRVLIVAERNSRVTIIDESVSDGDGFISSVVEIVAGEGAHVEYYDVNRWGPGVMNFKTVRAVLGRDATFTALAAGIGSKLTKMRIDTEMPEAGAQAQLLGVTFGDGDQHFDYNTLQDHTGEHTISDLQFKSALTGRSSLVWYGITRINEPAGGSEANQTSRNLLLSEHAKASPIPILEIKAHDVSKCSHGATAGPVEEEELFYLEARAIPRATAEQMLVEGFFADVIDRIPNADLRDRVMAAVLEKAGGTTETLTFDEIMAAG
jgi:Fe-S cluster assembly protein SufD